MKTSRLLSVNTKRAISKYGYETCREAYEMHMQGMSLDEAVEMIEAANLAKYCKPWIETTEEHFWEMLEVLPPEKWQTVNGVEIFRMMEYLTGDITTHFARLGNRYFTANRDTSTGYDVIAGEIAKLCAERGEA